MRILLLLLTLSLAVTARAASRTVTLEWEPDPDATSYEMELGKKGSQKAFSMQSEIRLTSWSGPLNPGRYWMRVRGKDDRGLVGEWSASTEFQVKLGFADPLKPRPGDVLPSTVENADVTFEWRKLEGATGYNLTLMTEAGELVESRKVSDNTVRLSLPVARKYMWYVQGLDDMGTSADKPSEIQDFVLEGPALAAVALEQPDSGFVRQIKFAKPAGVEQVRLILSRFDPEKKEWAVVTDVSSKRGSALPFKSTWRGGKYQLTARTESQHRSPSPSAEITFEVKDGDRSPASENRALIRQSIERTQNWFFTGSYVISQVNYFSTLVSQNRTAATSAITGSAQLGAGYFWAGSPWGTFATFEYGGLTLPSGNHTFMGLELLGMYKMSLARSDEMRFKLGLFQQQIPELISTVPIKAGNATVTGPLAGFEYWHALSPKWSMQGNALMRMNMQGRSATGRTTQTSTSLQAGAMAAYRYRPTLTTLMGYSYRSSSLKYEDANALFGASGTSQTDITGHYLQLSVEYDY